MTIAVQELTSAEAVFASHRALRAKFYTPLVKIVEPSPEPVPEPPRRITLDELRSREIDDAVNAWLDLSPIKTTPLWKTILKVVSAEMGVSHAELLSAGRLGRQVHARQIACWLMRDLSGMSFPSIGARMGGRDHTTILHAWRKIQLARSVDRAFAVLLDDLIAKIRREA